MAAESKPWLFFPAYIPSFVSPILCLSLISSLTIYFHNVIRWTLGFSRPWTFCELSSLLCLDPLVNRSSLQSTGRGGVGNIRQPSQSADKRPTSDGPDDFSVTRGREPIVNPMQASTVTWSWIITTEYWASVGLLYRTRRCRKYTLPISRYPKGPRCAWSRGGGCHKRIQEVTRGCPCSYPPFFYIPSVLTVKAFPLGFQWSRWTRQFQPISFSWSGLYSNCSFCWWRWSWKYCRTRWLSCWEWAQELPCYGWRMVRP